jgi:hypothetical protein
VETGEEGWKLGINMCMWDSAMCKVRNKYVVKQKLKKQNSNVYGYSLLESLRKKDVLNIEGGGVGVTQGEGGRGGLRWRSANRRGGN